MTYGSVEQTLKLTTSILDDNKINGGKHDTGNV
jgi:hypothetical protein